MKLFLVFVIFILALSSSGCVSGIIHDPNADPHICIEYEKICYVHGYDKMIITRCNESYDHSESICREWERIT